MCLFRDQTLDPDAGRRKNRHITVEHLFRSGYRYVARRPTCPSDFSNRQMLLYRYLVADTGILASSRPATRLRDPRMSKSILPVGSSNGYNILNSSWVPFVLLSVGLLMYRIATTTRARVSATPMSSTHEDIRYPGILYELIGDLWVICDGLLSAGTT